jgi:uncharacterized protein YggE
MKRNLLVSAGLVVISLALVLSLLGFGGCTGTTTIGAVDLINQQYGIWVTGEGEVSVTPDIAMLYLGIEAEAETVADAQTQAADAMNDVLAALEDSGVAEQDIQTQYFSIDQVTRWDFDRDEQVVIGYRVTNMVTVTIRDIEEVGPIIDVVAAAGGDLTRINGISFSVDDPTPYYQEAREAAMADALAKAEQLADLAGVGLGEPFYISEGNIYPPVVYRDTDYLEEGVGAPSTPISAGEIELTLTLQVAYNIGD